MRGMIFGLAGCAALMAAPGLSQAAAYQDGHCQLTAPDGWVTSKTRIARPDKKVWASLLEAPTTAEIVNLELSYKAVKVSEDAKLVMLVSTASNAGLTNKQYHAVTKSSPACLADVTAPAGADEALAKQIAQTVTLKK